MRATLYDLINFGEWLDADQGLIAPCDESDERSIEDLARAFLAQVKE